MQPKVHSAATRPMGWRMADPRMIPTYVSWLRDESDAAKIEAAEALQNLTMFFDTVNKVAVREAGGIEVLVALLESSNTKVKWHVTMTLRYLVCNANQVAIRNAGGVEALVAVVESNNNDGTGWYASWALCDLAKMSDDPLDLACDNDDITVAIVLAVGRVDAIVELVRRGRVIVGIREPVWNAGAGAKRKAALVVAALLRDFPVPRDIKAVVASYL